MPRRQHMEPLLEVQQQQQQQLAAGEQEVPQVQQQRLQPGPQQPKQPRPLASLQLNGKGIRLAPAAAAVALGCAVRFLWPASAVPEGLDDQAWPLLSLFVTTIAGLVLTPLPSGAWALLCASAALAGHVLSFDELFAASRSTVVWLVFVSFLLARGFEKTGLGERIANQLLARIGGSTLGLSLGLAAAELLICPAMPSTTSRGAGLFMPVISSVSQAAGSMPGDDSRAKLGAFLTQAQFQASAHSSNFVLTAAAQNLLCIELAQRSGLVSLPDPFLLWWQGACVPAALGVLMAPLLLYRLFPPAITSTPAAPAAARARLAELGPLSRDEGIMLGAVGLAVVLWVFGSRLGVEPVAAAMLAVSALLAAGVLGWPDCLATAPAWDSLLWFTVVISMSLGLQSHGVIDAFSGWASAGLAGHGTWAVFAGLHALFFASHYLFASQTAHVSALYPAFLALMVAAGVPPTLAALSLAYGVNLFGSLTHYASGQAVVYSQSGFLTSKDVALQGAVCGLAALALWGSVGMAWWHALGWWA